MCNLFRTISISEDLESLTTGESMDKQKVDALVLNEVTIGEDIDDYPDENNGETMSSVEDIDRKIQQIEELRTKCRGKHSKLQLLFGIRYEELYAEKDKKRIASVKKYIMRANLTQI